MSNQNKFKAGDKVTRKQCADTSLVWEDFLESHGVQPYYTVTSVIDHWLRLEDARDRSFDPAKFELYQESAASDSWDYAEADRLEQAAKNAIKAYNEYVQRQPKKVYLPMYLPD